VNQFADKQEAYSFSCVTIIVFNPKKLEATLFHGQKGKMIPAMLEMTMLLRTALNTWVYGGSLLVSRPPF